jgi:protein-tyrosine-phosphatase/predicted ATP-grasp superfamily ATP-dependent carboligase
MGRVLVLGEDSRSCLAVVRSLGRKGVRIVLGVQSGESAVASHSRYAKLVIQMPSTVVDLEAWLAQLEKVLKCEQIDLVIPCSDSCIIPIVTNRARFESLTQLAIPDQIGFEFTFLKSKTIEMARGLGVPVPDTILVTDKNAIHKIGSERLRFPLIIKPISSKVWKEGRRFDLKVAIVKEFSTMQRIVEDMLEVGPVLLQEYFEGIGVGQEFLTHKGLIVSAFQHERVHEPLQGGGSSYRRGAPLDEEMLDCSKRMLAQLCWEGVAMIEYRKNPMTGAFTLMEINGRFWGSLPLAIASGVDFPYQLYCLMTRGEVRGSTSYRVGLHSRNLRKEIGWFKERLLSNSSPLRRCVSLAGQVLVGLKNTLLGKERFDEITLDDPAPALVELMSVVRSIGGKIGNLSGRVTFAILAESRSWRRAQRTRLRRLLNVDPNLLFVCRGNICRSPFAEGYTKLRLAAAGLGKIETLSAGTYPVGKRLPPQIAQNVSLEFGIRMDEHRSRVLEPGLAKWAGAIVCMDLSDYRELRAEFPQVKHKLFLLRAFDVKARDWEIPDPWGKSADDFRQGYTHISASVEALIQALSG